MNRSSRFLLGVGGVMLAGGLGLGWTIRETVDHDDPREDARRVYCLSPANRVALYNTTVALGLPWRGGIPSPSRSSTTPAGEVTVRTWSREPGGGFDRACDALVTMKARHLADPRSSPIGSLLGNPLVGVVVGGGLTYFTGLWMERRRWQTAAADTFELATAEYLKTARARIDQWQDSRHGPPPDWTDGDGRRADLRLALHRLRLPLPEEDFAVAALEQAHRLVTEAGWSIDGPVRETLAGELRSAVSELERVMRNLGTGSRGVL
ncbi:hypothetical protein [Rhizohabitans arisaemae]|uniref:hypothetical protein n=1 Tax=Rhizohabitans arisaemae TaxID=2720610 RepID=UPI0024B1C5DB|nr:hypothetical protein [Rhizohabitans arisaemae]